MEEKLMIMIVKFQLSFSKENRIQEYKILSSCKIIFMIYLSSLRNKTYQRTTKEEIETFDTKIDLESW